MSINNLFYPNPYTIHSNKNITNEVQIGDQVNSLMITNNLETPETITTQQMYNAITGGGGGNLSGTLTAGQVPVASGVNTLVDSVINQIFPDITIGDGTNDPEFIIKNSANNAFLDVNCAGNYVRTLNNQLDSSSGQGKFLNLSVQPFSNNTSTFQVLRSGSSGGGQMLNIDTNNEQTNINQVGGAVNINAVATTIQPRNDYSNVFQVNTANGFQAFNVGTAGGSAPVIQLGDGSNVNPNFQIKNQFGNTVFNVNSSTGQVNSFLNIYDDGNGNSQFVPASQFLIKTGLGQNLFNLLSSSNQLTLNTNHNIIQPLVDDFNILKVETSGGAEAFSVSTSLGIPLVRVGDTSTVNPQFRVADSTNFSYISADTSNQVLNFGSLSTATDGSGFVLDASAVPSAGGNHAINFVTAGGTSYIDASTGAFVPPSDERLKENITDLSLGLDFINQVKPRMYNMKTNSNKDNVIGFIAQELKELGFTGVSKKEEYQYGVDYNQMIPILVRAIQELSEQLKTK